MNKPTESADVLEFTRQVVGGFVDVQEPWLQDHHEVQDRCDCEDYLANGLSAYKWLLHCDALLREADARGIREYTRELFDAVTELYRAWLGPCAKAEEWIAQIAQRGHAPDNLNEFREACEAVEATIEDREWVAASAVDMDTQIEE